jgi:putative transposase
VHHVGNRGNDRRNVFAEPADHETFLALMARAVIDFPVTVHHFCTMWNHFHAIIRSDTCDALSDYMQWVEGNYATLWRCRTGTLGYGHVFKDRFWNVEIRDDTQYLRTARYVEANPLRAGFVRRAEHWAWSSLSARLFGDDRSLLSPPLVRLPPNWADLVNLMQRGEVLEEVRREYRGRNPVPPDD